MKIPWIPILAEEGKAGADDLKSPELCVVSSASPMFDAPFCDS